jgi:hypothetical protein
MNVSDGLEALTGFKRRNDLTLANITVFCKMCRFQFKVAIQGFK